MAKQFVIDSNKPHAFLSYVHDDDDYLKGGISWLREALESAVKANTGLDLKIFQDVEHIVPGEKWKNKLNIALESAQLFVPILTPRFFKSPFCRGEAYAFLDYEERADRDDLIIPIYLIGFDFLEDSKKRNGDDLLAKLCERQYHDWREVRFDLKKSINRPKIEELAHILANAAQRPAKTSAPSSSEGEIFGLAEAARSGIGRRTYIDPYLDPGSKRRRSVAEERSPFESDIASQEQQSTSLRDQIENQENELFTPQCQVTRPQRKRLLPKSLWVVCGGVPAAIFAWFLFDASLTLESGHVFRDCEQCPEMIIVPPGSFMMSPPKDEEGRTSDEIPLHEVMIDHPFAIGRHEVTRGQFASFVAGTGYKTAGCRRWDGDAWIDDANRDWRSPGYEQTDVHPVTCVSWEDAQAYVRWLSSMTGHEYRLPSETEWEYAARAGSLGYYFWGDDLVSACDHANGHDEVSQNVTRLPYDALPCPDGHAYTAPVGSFEANGFGLYDMSGNVWEWIEDNGRSPTNNDLIKRVLRGGSWSYNPENLRSTSRRTVQQASRNAGDGFRIARDLSYDVK